MEGLTAELSDHKAIMIDATYLKAHRTASSLRQESRQVGVTLMAVKAALRTNFRR